MRKFKRLPFSLLLALTLAAAAASADQPDMNGFSTGIWIDRERLLTLPTKGPAWNNVTRFADSDTRTPDLSDQEDMTNVRVFAKALVFARTGESRYRDDVLQACQDVMGSEGRSRARDSEYGRSLALARGLISYVLAADLVSLPQDQDRLFRLWLEAVVDEPMTDQRSLRSTHADRPNNWGSLAGASRLAVAAYLGNADDVADVARIFKGFLGDRGSYARFKYGSLSWQADASKPVGINPKGATKEGHSIDGVLPDDQRRAGGFRWPPPKTNYVYESLQGALAQAALLERAGYEAFNWQDRALLRAFHWLYDQANFEAVGDDVWQLFIINQAYGTRFPTKTPAYPGKGIAFTDWTHAQLF